MKKLNSILIVDDEADIRHIASLSLSHVGGYTVLTCASGEEAIGRLDEFLPDMVILDVMMPGMDGPTTLKNILQHPRGKSIPVVFMTAKIQPSEIEQYRIAGAVDVIKKPFDPMTLPDEILRAWEQYNLMQKEP